MSPPDDCPTRSLPRAALETICAHFGEDPHARYGAAAPPIYQTSTFVYPDAESFAQRGATYAGGPYIYTRDANPTTAILEAKLAELERGAWARCCASGVAAITTAIFVCLRGAAHVVAVQPCYAGYFLGTFLARFGVRTTFVPSARTEDYLAALRDDTQLLYLESPTGGWYEVLDLPALASAAHARGARVIVDNTWATPCFQNPLADGCDLVVHSASKYIGGHSDIVGGVIAGRDPELRRTVHDEGLQLGGSADPFATWLMLRGLRTLPLRMRQHERSGLAMARMLAAHPRVARVFHPGLESHPQHELARRQLRGFGGLLSFALREQSLTAVHRFMNRLKLFSIGVSWGGYESLVVGGDSVGAGEPRYPGVRFTVRLHCGLEATEDLLADARQALE